MLDSAARADNVIDLSAWRARRRPELMPDELLAELDAAGRVFDALLAQGHELRFDLGAPGEEARVRAELRSLQGEVVRAVPLAEVVGVADPDFPAA